MKFANDSRELDSIDCKLLSELQEDAKISLKEVGSRVGLSAPAAMERVRKLEQAGVITGYFARIDARKVGLDVAAFIGVDLSSGAIDELETWVAGVPQILECHHVTGGHTLLLKVRTRNTSELEALIRRLRSISGVKSTETTIVLSTRTERTQVALEPPDSESAPSGRRGTRRNAP